MDIKHRTKKLKDLVAIRDKVRLDPSWQRGPVWPAPKQALLIDSILRGYDIPMIYLWDRGAAAQPFRYEVVDGQQRLRAIWEFLDGDFSLNSDAPNIGAQPIAGKEYEKLPKSFRDKFDEFEVVIAYIENAQQPEISVVFSRMQMGVRLNPAELRNAIQTGYRQAVDTVARTHTFFAESKISAARFKHQDYLAHALSVCHHDGKREVKAPQLHDDYTYITDSAVYAPLVAEANNILDFLKDVNELAAKKLTQKWIFVDLFYFLYRHRSQMGKFDAPTFAKVYLAFEADRMKHNAEPENLLGGKASKDEKDLYAYIISFKIGGGERSNLMQRADVIDRRFKKALGVS
ncbi:MAG: DUF262 domain-containing protein [Gammaproteobacteria bacterium]|uniref:GmrSD restriction endonucleases N-terminal domain-containing protein n=1 Tax=Thioclava marina TaxID=1915077 RepID=A0ABX3MJT0_9RHOB|nr:DUF262 domain-containing protein [Thioclava marina]MBD3754142.1 DUF262 domain-containing protein [Gammaproteobacteria bacterium]OOY11774.1 hypothetical protein BMG00_11855 [Thioclava marina]